MFEDPYHLQRFLDGQSEHYTQALVELRRGRKSTHWMWFVFPQIAGLGSSARFYAIKSLDEAVAFVKHPVLGTRLVECCEALLAHEERTAHEILGSPDDLKLRSSATLFSIADPQNPIFMRVIERFFNGVADRRTIDIIRSTR